MLISIFNVYLIDVDIFTWIPHYWGWVSCKFAGIKISLEAADASSTVLTFLEGYLGIGDGTCNNKGVHNVPCLIWEILVGVYHFCLVSENHSAIDSTLSTGFAWSSGFESHTQRDMDIVDSLEAWTVNPSNFRYRMFKYHHHPQTHHRILKKKRNSNEHLNWLVVSTPLKHISQLG